MSLKAVRALRGIRYAPETGFRIGALVTVTELAADAALRWELPALSDAAGRVAGPQIRNVATVGGNLCQRPRCWYFRNGFGLLPQHDGKSMVTEGDNRYHAILGNQGPAAFVTPSTLAPLLIALEAQAVLHGPNGDRKIPLEHFYCIPVAQGEIDVHRRRARPEHPQHPRRLLLVQPDHDLPRPRRPDSGRRELLPRPGVPRGAVGEPHHAPLDTAPSDRPPPDPRRGSAAR